MKQPSSWKPRFGVAGLWFTFLLTFIGAVAASPSLVTAPDNGVSQAIPEQSKEFQFTKVDLDLLREVNAFDKYIEQQGWIYSDPVTDSYIEKVALSLVPATTPENVKWRFRVLRDVEANAFALPNGSIYVNSELVSRMENEAQLAGVLAHEITHVVNRHSYLANRSARKKAVAIDIIQAAASMAYHSGVNPAIITAMGNLLPMIVTETIFGYSRELEHEADADAVENLYRHGYDVREFSRALELLRNGPEVELSPEPAFWASHPKLASRVEFVQERAAHLPAMESRTIHENAYRSATLGVLRHNAELAMLLGRPRTALANAQKLLNEQPGNAEDYVLLGDAYRSLGARSPTPLAAELTDEAKNATRKLMQKMTIAEYDRALLAEPQGPSRCQANFESAQEAFNKALTLDSQNATAHRGLGLLFERENVPAQAISQFEKYLELAPQARDARQIRMRLKALQSAPQTTELRGGRPALTQ